MSDEDEEVWGTPPDTNVDFPPTLVSLGDRAERTRQPYSPSPDQGIYGKKQPSPNTDTRRDQQWQRGQRPQRRQRQNEEQEDDDEEEEEEEVEEEGKHVQNSPFHQKESRGEESKDVPPRWQQHQEQQQQYQQWQRHQANQEEDEDDTPHTDRRSWHAHPGQHSSRQGQPVQVISKQYGQSMQQTSAPAMSYGAKPKQLQTRQKSTPNVPKAGSSPFGRGKTEVSKTPARPGNPRTQKTDVDEQRTGHSHRTIAVRGLESHFEQDVVELYFESKRSMGGPVEDITPFHIEGVIYVTFQSPDDAERVCQKADHKIGNKKLKVCLQQKPEMMNDRLLMRNLPDFFDAGDLQLFLKKQTKADAHTILFGDDESVALAIFDTSVDLNNVQSTLTGTTFHGHSLTADLVPKPSTIVVRNYTPRGPDDETIEFYFDNKKRSGGGGVTEVKFCPGDGNFIVTFKDPEVIANVMGKRHQIGKQSLDVSLHHQCLGSSGGHEQRSLQIPAPVELSPDVDQKLSLLLQIPDMKDDVPRLLERHHACMDTDPHTWKTLISCNITKDTQDCRHLLQTWKEDIQEAITTHSNAFTVGEEIITKDEFDEALPKLKQLADRCGGEAGFVFHDREKKISIVFHTERQGERVEEMKSAIHDTKKRLHRATNVETRTVEMSQQEIKMMQNCHIEQSVMEKYPQLQVIYDAENEAIFLEGLPEEVDELDGAISRLKKKITHLSPKFDSPLAAQLFLSAEAKAVLREACLKKDPQGLVEFTSSGFNVSSLDAIKASEMRKAGKETIQKKELKKSSEVQEAWETREFDDLLKSIEERRQGTLVIKRPDQSTVVILGVMATFPQDVQEIEDFLKEESAGKLENFDMDPQNYDLFCTFVQNQPRTARDFSLQYDADNSKLQATTSKTGLTELKTLVQNFQKSLISQTKEFTQPSFVKYIKSRAGSWKLNEISTKQTCRFGEFVDEGRRKSVDGTDTLNQMHQGQGGQVQPNKGREFLDPKLGDDSPVIIDTNVVAPKYPRIFLTAMNDITKVEHHFFVNSSNPELELSMGQVSNAFIGIGGPKIQEECKEKYPNGINYGDIAITGPGRTKADFEFDGKPRLDCKHILHCCLPFISEEDEMKRVVKEAVTKSLSVAEDFADYERKCIGFPALGAGNLGYPPELVAETMYHAVMEYGNEHPDTTIEDVYFVLHRKDDTLAAVFIAEDARYRQAQKVRIGGGQQEDQSYLWNKQPTTTGFESHNFFQKTSSSVKVTITALSQKDIDDAVEDLLSGYRGEIVESTPETDRLNFWGPAHIHQVITSCRVAEVDVTLNFDLSRLTIRGHRDNVHVSLLHNIIKEAEDDISERENAHLVSYQVQWNWVEVEMLGEVLRPYDQLNNYRIEKAYRDGKTTSIVYDKNRTPFQINFEKMLEIPELTDPTANPEDDDAVDVIRQDKILEMAMDAPSPDNWAPMSGELDLVQLKPDTHSQEYKKVLNDFMSTILTDFNVQSGTDPNDLFEVVKIQRVQNLTLHKQYMAMRKQMESKFPQGFKFEKRPLWHGTKEDVAESIIKYGFNRSFCNRSKYGEAVYFAKTANYSSAEKYAQRNACDERIIFYCRVLVGEYMQGQEGMRFLPTTLTGGQKDYDSAVDDVNDPAVFVVYKDAQAYPEYQITFKDK